MTKLCLLSIVAYGIALASASAQWQTLNTTNSGLQSNIIKEIAMEQYKKLEGEPKQEDFSYLRLRIK